MPESTMPRYLSHAHARELADDIECAIARAREEFRRKWPDTELRGLEHEIMLALARTAVRYGFDILPSMASTAIERLEVATAELEAKLEAARMASAVERRTAIAAAEAPGYPTIELDRERFLGENKIACWAIIEIEVVGAGENLSALACTELRHYCDDRTVEEFEAAARAYFESVGLVVRSYILEDKTASFHVGSGT